MEHGYYWLHLKDQEPEVVEIDGNSMHRCGSDVGCYLEDGKWHEGLFAETMDVVSIIGPLTPTDGRMFVTEYLRLGDDGPEIVRHALAEWPEWAEALREMMTPNAEIAGSALAQPGRPDMNQQSELSRDVFDPG